MFRDKSVFQPTIEAAGEHLGVSAVIVEKDYWVSQALRVLGDEFPDDFVFKGGTSLSKAYGLIERFSEDIDLLVVAGSRGRGAVDRLMKDMGEAVGQVLGGPPISENAERGTHRTYRIGYSTGQSHDPVTRSSVLLEMGIRGGSRPCRRIEIQTMLGNVLADAGTDVSGFADLEPFSVHVLHPGRTLLEKLYAIHAEAVRLSSDVSRPVKARVGRHFYDVFQLLGNEEVAKFLADAATVSTALEEIEFISREHFARGSSGEFRPEGGFRFSPAFDASSNVAARLRIAYESDMGELYYGKGPWPTWADVCKQMSSSSV